MGAERELIYANDVRVNRTAQFRQIIANPYGLLRTIINKNIVAVKIIELINN